MAKAQQPSLTELCTICHTNVPKYKCPRCDSRTCSLACSKKHKLWSECSGVRDPAAYLKRKDLATPVAFDKDFNFITGIERSLERADRDAENRGIPLDTSDRKGRNDHVKGEVSLQRAIERSGVKVIRAPKGMTRNKQNISHWHKKSKCLNWCVEWIFPAGQSTIIKCLESTEIGTTFSRIPLAKELGLVGSNPSKRAAKRQKMEKDTLTDEVINPETTTPSEPLINTGNEEKSEHEKPHSRESLSRTLSPEPSSYSHNQLPSPSHLNSDTPARRDSTTSSSETSSKSHEPKLHFYLHRPRTRSKVPVLTPISKSMTLDEALRGQVVLEFPTIYVLKYSAKEFPDEYMLAKQYLLEHGDQGLPGEEDEEEDAKSEEKDQIAGVDETKVLEVLRKDLENQVDGWRLRRFTNSTQLISKLWENPRLKELSEMNKKAVNI